MAYFKMARALWKPVVNDFVEKYDTDSTQLLKIHKNVLDSTEQLFNKAIALDSTEFDFFYFRGDFKMATHGYIAALKDFDAAIEIRPYRPTAIQSAGFCLHYLGDKKKACGYFERWAVLLDPNNPNEFFQKKEWTEKYCKEANK
jgi:tetratricopeptide (TPR) repeat protein